ncbi:formate dehydrogenase accessory protein FdhE [Desulfospira joergensenii]|uniref:formate dehydrogenase accessory protein FdhE n=1 Tax=Desulfospira joergensenii TaxID=53329 RepID=UPI0003B3F57B|nr:formate dehydrogenase accessory protein FdhE [Desulfospira joergensenii]
MNLNDMIRPEPSIEDIDQAARLIQKARPSYGPIIEFYGQVFIAQEKSRQALELDPILIDSELLKLKFDNGMPLIDPSQFRIDRIRAESLLKTLCSLASNHAPKLASHARKLQAGLDRLDLDLLFQGILENRETAIEKAALDMNMPVHVLMFFVFLSMAPSLQTCASQLAVYLKDSSEPKKGYCPVCGSHPNAAFLDPEGKRVLMCSLCAHEWHTRRMGCVFCDSNDTRLQHYFFNEEEKEYRVYLCDNCQNYLKVIDLRVLNRTFVPRLEQIATLHLDMKAREKGYKNALPGFHDL